MANIENVKLAIQVMERATRLNMSCWQSLPNGSEIYEENCTALVNSISELHNCGNTACFAGYLAISGIPGWSIVDGIPRYENTAGLSESDYAVQEFLEISGKLARCLVYGSYDFYPIAFHNVTPEHVIEKLNLILTGELQ
ncbi:hypothetical protein TF_48 [Pseudomonas phage vB_PaeP_TF17]|nr:hypothetical protein TF_48 [Pseudomonas phage vB_PaeP_TF17]